MKLHFTTQQRLAFHLAKNHIHDSESILTIYKAASLSPHPTHSYELAAELQKDSIESEMAKIEKSGVKMVFYGYPGYPEALLDIPDAPVMLFLRSVTEPEELFNNPKKTYKAIVGTRDISKYGQDVTRRLVEKLSFYDLNTVIVSGLAIGVDILAHNEAIRNNMMTLAVVPSPVDSVYPSCNRKTAEILAEKEGCAIISPFVPGTEPCAANFLIRNRIVAGLCSSTIVVESKIKGGAIHTANLAQSYNRHVFAVPGRIDDVRSEGCNRLIKAGTAEILTF